VSLSAAATIVCVCERNQPPERVLSIVWVRYVPRARRHCKFVVVVVIGNWECQKPHVSENNKDTTPKNQPVPTNDVGRPRGGRADVAVVVVSIILDIFSFFFLVDIILPPVSHQPTGPLLALLCLLLVLIATQKA
jgi:hypothetical protein